MSPFLFIAPVAVVVIGYMVLRSQSQGSKVTPASKTEKSSSELPIFPFIDNHDQSSVIQTATDRHSHNDQNNSTAPSSCNDVITDTSSSSSTSSWDTGSSNCSIDSSPSPSIDTNNY